MIPLGPVVARTTISAARAVVWAYLTQQTHRARWWPEIQLEATLGGAISERWAEGHGDDHVSRDATGTVDVAVVEHALGFRWKEAGDTRSTAVLITLRTLVDGTSVTVTETGFDSLTDAAARAAASQEGWGILLRDLKVAAEAADPIAAAEVPAAIEAVPVEVDEDDTDEGHTNEDRTDEDHADDDHTDEVEADDDDTDALEVVEGELIDASDDDADDDELLEVEATGDPDFDELIRGLR